MTNLAGAGGRVFVGVAKQRSLDRDRKLAAA
jgi:hypothetical protein